MLCHVQISSQLAVTLNWNTFSPPKMLTACGIDADVKIEPRCFVGGAGSRLLEYSISSPNIEKASDKKIKKSHFMPFQKATSQHCFVLLSQRDLAIPPTLKEKE